ncbi:hypothetical protein ROSI111154_18230 [Rouxiella silvae]
MPLMGVGLTQHQVKKGESDAIFSVRQTSIKDDAVGVERLT